jgi:predicted MFS family arabinose efflux permease
LVTTVPEARTRDRAPLLTRPVCWFLLFSFVSQCSLSLLFSVLPLFASETTGLSLAAGLTTGAMMLATVVMELGTPRLMADVGYRRVMEMGMALLGFPALILILVPDVVAILCVAAARGAGLAISVVAGTALAARLFPVGRRAEGLGIYGLVVSIPVVALLPFGLWLAERFSFDLVFGVAAVTAVAGLAMGRTLPAIHPGARPTHGILTELRDPGILRLAVIFSLSTFAVGILVTYLALAVPEDARHLAAIGLFVQALGTSAARWGAGRLGDRVGSQRLLAPSMLLCATGILGIAAASHAVAVIGGMALFGLGLGGAQNSSLAVMFERASGTRAAQVRVIWNLASDAGMGLGAVGFGLVSGITGYPWGFALTAAILFASIPFAWRDDARVPAGAGSGVMSDRAETRCHQ